MPKILIDISDAPMEDYQDLVHKIRGMAASEGLYDDKNPSQKAKVLGAVLDILTAITNGIVLPDNPTNGDMIKVLFPKCEIMSTDNTFYYVELDSYFPKPIFKNWWNASYKEVEDALTILEAMEVDKCRQEN